MSVNVARFWAVLGHRSVIDMKRQYFIVRSMGFRLTILPVLALSFLWPFKTSAADGTATITEGNTIFALDIYGQLKAQEGNLFFSPYSISTCLAMTYAGARG